MRIVGLERGRLIFVRFGSSLFTVEDDCCSVEKKGLTSLLGFRVLFRDYCEHCFFLFCEGEIEITLILLPFSHC